MAEVASASPAPPAASPSSSSSKLPQADTKPTQDGDKDTEMENGTGELHAVLSTIEKVFADFLHFPRSTSLSDSKEDSKDELPEGATEVLYINNLNERIKLDSTSHSLPLFSLFACSPLPSPIK